MEDSDPLGRVEKEADLPAVGRLDHKLNRLMRELQPYLSEGGSWGPEHLVDGINGYADDRGQGHGEADSQGPAGINVVVVGDGLVLDHCEHQDELGGERERERGRLL